MIFINKKGMVVYANEMCEKVMGYSLEEFYSPDFDFLKLVAPEFRELAMENFRKHSSGIDIPPYEYTLVTKTGKKLDITITTKIIDYEGEQAILGIITDITERKKMEDALKEEEFKLREYFENLPVPAYNVTFDGKINDCNNITISTLGYDNKNELIGKDTISTIYAPSSQEKAKQLFEKWRKWGKLKNEELQVITKQGEIKDVLLNVDTIYDHKGVPLYSISTQLDISERKRAEQQLSIFKRFAEVSSLAYGFADLDGNIIYSNPALRRILGEENPEDALGKNVEIYYPDDMKSKLLNEVIPTVKSEGGWIGELSLLSIKGDVTPTIQNVSLIRNEKGEPLYLGNVITDITERKKAEDALKKSEEKYRLHFENATDVIYSVDTEFKILSISPSVKKTLGYEPEELIGRKFQDLNIVSPDYLETAFTDTMRVLSGESISASVYEFITKDGSRRFGEVSGSPLISDGKVVAIVSVARDITERKKAEEQISALSKFPSENPSPVLRIAKDGEILYSNTAGLELLAHWGVKIGKKRLRNGGA